jgi:hypothetical protein
MDILGSVANVMSGGAAGGLGAVLGSIAGLGKSWLDQRHQLKIRDLDRLEKQADREHDLALMDREAEIDLAKSAQEVRGRISEADLANLQAGLELEAKEQETLLAVSGKLSGLIGTIAAGLLFVAEFIRKLMRPAITSALLVATFKLWLDLGVGVADLEIERRLALMTSVVDMVLFLTSVAVTFWFISRPHAGREMPEQRRGTV